MARRLAIDIGRTFTDLVSLEEIMGDVILEKNRITPSNFADGVMRSLWNLVRAQTINGPSLGCGEEVSILVGCCE